MRKKSIHKMVALAMVVGIGILVTGGCASYKKMVYTPELRDQDQEIKFEG